MGNVPSILREDQLRDEDIPIRNRDESITSTLFTNSKSSKIRRALSSRASNSTPQSAPISQIHSASPSIFKENYSLSQNTSLLDTNRLNTTTSSHSNNDNNLDGSDIPNQDNNSRSSQLPLFFSPGPSSAIVESTNKSATCYDDIEQQKLSSISKMKSPPTTTNHRPSIIALRQSLEENGEISINEEINPNLSTRSSISSFSTNSNTRSASIDIPMRNSISKNNYDYRYLQPDEPEQNQEILHHMLNFEKKKKRDEYDPNNTNNLTLFRTDTDDDGVDPFNISDLKLSTNRRKSIRKISMNTDDVEDSLEIVSNVPGSKPLSKIDDNKNSQRTKFLTVDSNTNSSPKHFVTQDENFDYKPLTRVGDTNNNTKKLLSIDESPPPSKLMTVDNNVVPSKPFITVDDNTSYKPHGFVIVGNSDSKPKSHGFATVNDNNQNSGVATISFGHHNKARKIIPTPLGKIYPGEEDEDDIIESVVYSSNTKPSRNLTHKPLTRVSDSSTKLSHTENTTKKIISDGKPSPQFSRSAFSNSSSTRSSQSSLQNQYNLSRQGTNEDKKASLENGFRPLSKSPSIPSDIHNIIKPLRPIHQRVTSEGSSSSRLHLHRLRSLEQAPSGPSKELIRQLSRKSFKADSPRSFLHDSPKYPYGSSNVSSKSSFCSSADSILESQLVIIKYRDKIVPDDVENTKISLVSKDITMALHYDTSDLLSQNNKLELKYDKDQNVWILPNLLLPIGIYQVQFLVNSDLKHSDFLPTATDKYGNIVNWFEVVPTYGSFEPYRDDNYSSSNTLDYSQIDSTSDTIKPPSLKKMTSISSSHTNSSSRSRSLSLYRSNSSNQSRRSGMIDIFRPVEAKPIKYSNEIPPIFAAASENQDILSENSKSNFLDNIVECNQEQVFGEILGGGLIDTETAENMFLDKYPVPELPIFLNSKYMHKVIGEINQPTGIGPPSSLDNSDHEIPHVNLQHLLTSSIRKQTIGIACTTRYEGKFITQILYSPIDYENELHSKKQKS